METIIFETNRAVSAVQSVIVVSNEKEMERAMRDQRFYHLSIAQERQLFYSKLVLGLLEITFASGWCREHEFISGHGEIFVPRNVCVRACRIARCLLKFPTNSHTLHRYHNLLGLTWCHSHISSEIRHLFEKANLRRGL